MLKTVSDFEDIGHTVLFMRHKHDQPRCRGPVGQILFLLLWVNHNSELASNSISTDNKQVNTHASPSRSQHHLKISHCNVDEEFKQVER